MFDNSRLQIYIRQRISIMDKLMDLRRRFNGKMLKQRNMFVKIKEHVDRFEKNQSNRHWVIIPGLRGTGKTTLLAQIYFLIRRQYPDTEVIYFAIDEVCSNGFTLRTLLDAYLGQINTSPNGSNKIVILLDEIQGDCNWAKTLKVFHDEHPNVFLICSGSSAVHLQTNADIAGRRANIECLYPMSFCEYEFIKHNIYPIKGLKTNLSEAIFDSTTAQECYHNLKTLEPDIESYCAQIQGRHWSDYIYAGSIPFTLAVKERNDVYRQVLQTVDKVIHQDLPQIDSIDPRTVPVAKSLLILLSESDAVSINKIAACLSVSNMTISSILSALCKAELLIDIIPYGSNFTAAKKCHKYLFSSSVIRSAFNYMNGTGSSKEVAEGRMLEDVMALQFYKRNGVNSYGNIFYDSSQNGADFIVKTGGSAVVFESGRGRKTGLQVEHSMKQIPRIKYGVTVCDTPNIRLSDNQKSVFIPWRVFALAG